MTVSKCDSVKNTLIWNAVFRVLIIFARKQLVINISETIVQEVT